MGKIVGTFAILPLALWPDLWYFEEPRRHKRCAVYKDVASQ